MKTSGRVLVVDDEPNLRLMFRSALEASGLVVTEAADGLAALDELRRRPADLVLLDLRMPGLDGMATLGKLRESGDDVPVVIVTAHGSVPDAVAAMRLGAIDFLTKPITPDALRRTVAEVLGRGGPTRDDPAPTVEDEDDRAFVISLAAAKRALNRREFEAAEDLLRLASHDRPEDVEVRTLRANLHKLRQQENGPFRVLRRLV